MSPKRRIGLTMRVVEAANYVELRDALAQDWVSFFKTFDSFVPIPLLNGGETTLDWAKALNLDGIIFTGGNDLGDSAIRDDTEQRLLQWAVEERIPALGVCRGAQLMNAFWGGELMSVDFQTHVATNHSVTLCDPLGDYPAGFSLKVNSYHNFAIDPASFPSVLCPWAMSEDGSIEGFRHRDFPIYGVMWHPERPMAPEAWDRYLFTSLFSPQKEIHR